MVRDHHAGNATDPRQQQRPQGSQGLLEPRAGDERHGCGRYRYYYYYYYLHYYLYCYYATTTYTLPITHYYLHSTYTLLATHRRRMYLGKPKGHARLPSAMLMQ